MGTYDSEEIVSSSLFLGSIITCSLELTNEKIFVLEVTFIVVIAIHPKFILCPFNLTAVHDTPQ